MQATSHTHHLQQHKHDKLQPANNDNLAKPDFQLIWQNLTYKVNTRTSWPSFIGEKLSFGKQRRQERAEQSQSSTNRNLILPSPHDACAPHRNTKVVLDRVCGSVKSRQLTAILGPSGAGKSSLLHCLFRNRTEGASGRILVDSNQHKLSSLQVNFIPQTDYHNDYLSVREDLRFVSKLCAVRLRRDTRLGNDSCTSSHLNKLPAGGKTFAQHEENVLRVAGSLGLTACLDVSVGKISGGQRKRLAIARELMSRPDVLVLDEPTTGLDSTTALKTVRLLRDLARCSAHPLAVVCTIHQPSRAVFDLFDKAYFLSSAGCVVYDDAPENVAPTLEQVVGVRSAGTNPAAALIDISSDVWKSCLAENLSNYQRARFAKAFSGEHIGRLLQQMSLDATGGSRQLLALRRPERTCDCGPLLDRCPGAPVRLESQQAHRANHTRANLVMSAQLKASAAKFKHTWSQSIAQTRILTHRYWLELCRNSTLVQAKLAYYTLMPLIILLVFGTTSGRPNGCPNQSTSLDVANIRKSSETTMRLVEELKLTLENTFFLFVVNYGCVACIATEAAARYPQTVSLIRKETSNGLYVPGAYYAAQLLASFPQELFFPSLTILIAYTLSGQASSYLHWRLLAVVVYFFLACYSANAIGLLLGATFERSVILAVLGSQFVLFPGLFLGGFIWHQDNMQPLVRRVSDATVVRNALLGMLTARYGFNICDCHDDTFEAAPNARALAPILSHVLDYLVPKEQLNGTQASEIFSELARRVGKVTTFGLNITSCHDVKPFLVSHFRLTDDNLYLSAIWFVQFIVMVRLVAFFVFKRLH